MKHDSEEGKRKKKKQKKKVVAFVCECGRNTENIRDRGKRENAQVEKRVPTSHPTLSGEILALARKEERVDAQRYM